MTRVEPARGRDPLDLELTVAEAARLCRTSPEAIRRAVRARRFPHAYRRGSSQGAWLIPVDDLIDARLCTVAEAELAAEATTPEAHVLRRELAERDAALAEARLRLEAYETRLRELGAALEHARRVELLRAQAPVVVVSPSPNEEEAA